MVTVYYTKVFTHLQEREFLSYLDKIEEERRKKILLMKKEESRLQSLTAGSLLHFALCERMGDVEKNSGPFSMGYGRNGKPYLKEYPDIHFNLSHSGRYVCCALSHTPVGVDIQKITDVKRGIAERFFTGKDNQRLEACGGEERKALFFRMWSIKESFIKLTGEGIAGGLDSFEIDWKRSVVSDGGKTEPSAYFSEWNELAEYSACVCSREPLEKVVWKKAALGCDKQSAGVDGCDCV